MNIIDQIVEQNLNVYRASPSRLQEDVSQEAQVASDYRGRLVYELLQNADDAMEGQGTEQDSVKFVVTDDALWMANNGRALTDPDIQGLCGLGASSKVDAAGTRRASIGHKGLGFKSVLEITEAPAVFSTTHSFELGVHCARPHVDGLWAELGHADGPRGVPAMRFPAPIDGDENQTWTMLRNDSNVAFRFPFRDSLDSEGRSSLADLLLDLPLTTVLFLKHLEEVVVEVEQAGRSERQTWTIEREVRSGETWTRVPGLAGTGIYRISVTSSEASARFVVAHDADLQIGGHRTGLNGPAWDGVDVTEISVAALEPESDEMPEAWRHFHVFLPTQEPCPYPILVNGAFATDLSRKQVRVSQETGDYNAHLVRSSARLFAEQLVPLLLEDSPHRLLEALDRGEAPQGSDASDLLHEELTEALRDVPLLPSESGSLLKLGECVLPPSLLGSDGEYFRELLPTDAVWGERSIPAGEFCTGRWARIASDHGADQLSVTECLVALGQLADPQRSALREHESLGFEVDPVLDVCAMLWDRAEWDERDELEAQARLAPVFPTERNDDGTVRRVALGEDTAFYPPQSAGDELPLRGLQFMAHAVCWGALNPNERNALLGEQMRLWTGLFGVGEFRFQEVMRAAVLPALQLTLTPEQEAWREELKDENVLAAICQLAGSFTKPDRPLRYQRLRSDRAIFNLSRLPVPCRSADGETVWKPAYRVYFGEDWTSEDSVERVLAHVSSGDEAGQPEVYYLVEPERLLPLLDGATLESADGDSANRLELEAGDDEEVGDDEDIDQAVEGDPRSRWLSFLSWIGVNSSLRLVHFHDVEDRDTGWLTTKELAQPKGWAFAQLGDVWANYRSELEAGLDTRTDRDEIVPYLYEVHDLEFIGALINAAEKDVSSGVAYDLFQHLARHWPSYAMFADAQLALVSTGKSPGQRTRPPRAVNEELIDVADNLWLHRLRRAAVCPTTRGPRQPDLAWRPTMELERRFGRAGHHDASHFVPVLRDIEGAAPVHVRALSDRLGVRAEVTPFSYTIEDARHLCRQLAERYGPRVSNESDVRNLIRPTYRAMFDLLRGRAEGSEEPALPDELLLAETAEGFEFVEAHTVLFTRTPGIKERSRVGGQLPIFIIEAEDVIVAPMRQIFGARSLESVLDWQPNPGECSMSPIELEEVRVGLKELVRPLLARVRVQRNENRDRTDLERFANLLEPVDELKLACFVGDRELESNDDRRYFVETTTSGSQRKFKGFIVWDRPGWPPSPETSQALAMALADTLELNLVETFLAFITNDQAQREQLLQIAGGWAHYEELVAELEEPLPEPAATEPSSEATEPAPPTLPERTQPLTTGPPIAPQGPTGAAPVVPLHSFDNLLLNGERLIVTGEEPTAPSSTTSGEQLPRGGGNGVGTGSHRAAPGVDISALDTLGTQIATAYERNRLTKDGRSVTVIAHGEMDGTSDSLVVEVHTPQAIAQAIELSSHVKRAMKTLEALNVSNLYPGFDLLSIRDGRIDRLIELKSSAVDARVQEMSWNEWKSAANSKISEQFWLYVVGNLRSDLAGAMPYVRAINNPFGTLNAATVENRQLRRAVQLRVREFEKAEHLSLAIQPK